MAEALPDFLVGYVGLCLRDIFDGEFSDDDDVSSTASEKIYLLLKTISIYPELPYFWQITSKRIFTSLCLVFGLLHGFC